jgi:mannose-6-phosphate isomerase-like protein (cupin superfamily)
MDEDFVTMTVPDEPDLQAPDGSEIRLLPRLSGGSMVHCALPPGGVSLAVTHRTVEEIWYVVEGWGQLWRQSRDREEVTDLRPGLAVTIPLGTRFQFRSAESGPLRFVIVTMPPWPGADEALRVEDHWPVRAG